MPLFPPASGTTTTTGDGSGTSFTQDPGTIPAVKTVTANRAWFSKAKRDAITITKINYQVGTSSGNISLAICRNAAAGAGAPATRQQTTGAIACPASGYVSSTITSVAVDPTRDYYAFSADNGTVTVGAIAQPNDPGSTAWNGGLNYFQDTAHPIPSPPSPTASAQTTMVMVGLP